MPRNKAHKQRFSSKRAFAGNAKGRFFNSNAKGVKTFLPMGTKERIRKSVILQHKRSASALKTNQMGSLGGAPRVIGVIPANESGNTDLVVQGICRAMGGVKPDTCFPFSMTSKEKKANFTFMWENQYNDQDCIDIAKVADFLVFTLDASQSVQQTIREMQDAPPIEYDHDEGCSMASGKTWFGDIGLCITDFTRSMITALNAQGVPSIVVVLQNLETFAEKQRQKVLRVHQRYFTSVLPDTTKTFAIVEDNEYDSLLRHLQVTKLRSLLWREQHPYLVVEQGSYLSDTQKLIIGGYLRGMSISSKQLIHLTNYGTYQIEGISFNDPTSGDPHYADYSQVDQREPLEHVQANATLEDAEEPTEEDLVYHHSLDTKKIRVPEGVSDYQAAWYDLEENEISEETPMPINLMGEEDASVGAEFLSHYTSKTDVDFLKVRDIIRLERVTDEEREAEIERIREESEGDAWNPDMVNTPLNLPARERFAKYRGLKSFPTGKWDITENLPPHYAYVYKLQGITRIRKAALTKCAEGPVVINQFVYITIVGVPKSVWENAMTSGYIIASGQLEHEQKWSVLHFQVQRNLEWEEPIKSKTPMLAHIGFRKFYVSPLFSDITASDRTKFARFFHPSESFCMASFFGPISYQPCPILLFEVPSLEEQKSGDSLRLACFGGALPPNPDLLILKRAVLTGRVATIHKKQIVVKYMFFNDNDVRWFQPVDLRTRMGRRGKITKAVGTHGLFKASLNDQVMQHDLVCMDLYKRVFPKWTTLPFNIADLKNYSNEEMQY